MEKISCLICNSCLSKRAKLKSKLKRKHVPLTSPNNTFDTDSNNPDNPSNLNNPNNPNNSVDNNITAIVEETTSHIENIKIEVPMPEINLVFDPIIDVITPNPKVSSSPRKVAKKSTTLKPSPITSGPLLSSFFTIVPKENDQLLDITDQNLNLIQTEDSSGFWSYFPQFFVKPNVKMAPLSRSANKISTKSFILSATIREIEEVTTLPLIRFKLFHFAENIRPYYFGTFSKKSSAINGRRPFIKDTSESLGLDYSIDSDDEWEDFGDELEGGVENLSDTDQSDSSMDEEDDEEEDSCWLVPHGYLSEDEVMGSDYEDNPSSTTFLNEDLNDPVTRKRLQDSWRSTTNQNISLGNIPKIYSSLRTMTEQDSLFLSTLQMQWFMPLLANFTSINPLIDGLIIKEDSSDIKIIKQGDPAYDEMTIPKRKKKKVPIATNQDMTKKVKNSIGLENNILDNIPNVIVNIQNTPINSILTNTDQCSEKENNILMDCTDNNQVERPKKRITPIIIPSISSSLSTLL